MAMAKKASLIVEEKKKAKKVVEAPSASKAADASIAKAAAQHATATEAADEEMHPRTSMRGKRSEPAKPTPASAGVVVVSRIPYGFFEDQMRGFFSQFGVISRLRLSRNRKTGKSRHFAFIEFESKEVAAIVAETMNGYMMFGRTLQCSFRPASEVHPATFRGADRPFKVVPWARINRREVNAPRTAEQVASTHARLLSREEEKRAKLAALGFKYDFPGYAQKEVQLPKPAPKAEKKPAVAATAAKADVSKTGKKVKASEPAAAVAAPVAAVVAAAPAKGKAAKAEAKPAATEKAGPADAEKPAKKGVKAAMVDADEEPAPATAAAKKGKKAPETAPAAAAPAPAAEPVKKGKKAAAAAEPEPVAAPAKKATKATKAATAEPVAEKKTAKKAAPAPVEESEEEEPVPKKAAKKVAAAPAATPRRPSSRQK
jgi:nucleolar protein 15